MKLNEQEPKYVDKDEIQRERFTLEEEVERLSPITEVDPYLAQQRQKEQDSYEKEFERKRHTRQEKERDTIERLKLQAQDALENDSIQVSVKEVKDARTTPRDVYRRDVVSKKRWFNPNALVGWATGLLGLFGAKESKAVEMTDSTDKKHAKIEAVRAVSKDSLRNENHPKEIQEVVERKKLGKITLEGRLVVPYHDPSIEVSIAYFSGNENDENKIGTMISEMEKLGYEPAPAHVLDEIMEENKTLSKKAPWLMTFEQQSDLDDTRSMEKTVTVSENNGKEEVVVSSPELAVYPTYNPTGKRGRFEANKGITYGEEGYGYVFVKKNPTASYESGIVRQ